MSFVTVIAGGVVRGSDGGIVGEAASDFIRQFKVDFAVIGASAIDADGALLDYDFREVRVAQAIIANARHVILVCDGSKFGRAAPVRIGHLNQVATFVTDRAPPALAALCHANDVRLVEAGPGRGTLMADVLRATAVFPGFHRALSVHLALAHARRQAECGGAGGSWRRGCGGWAVR